MPLGQLLCVTLACHPLLFSRDNPTDTSIMLSFLTYLKLEISCSTGQAKEKPNKELVSFMDTTQKI